MKTALVAVALAACSPGVPTVSQQQDVAQDALDQKLCVDQNTTKEAIDACRAAVKAKRAK